MDTKTGEADGSVGKLKSSDVFGGDGGLGSKIKGVGSISNKEVFFRADKIDLKSLDYQLEKHLSRVWSRDREVQTPKQKQEWEIDLSKLDIRTVIAHGTYGTVYRGVYDGQDVAVKIFVRHWGPLEGFNSKR